MADIAVQKKESSPWIWWVLGALIVALLLYWLFGRGDNQVTSMDPTGETTTAEQMTGPAAPAMTSEANQYMAGCAAVQPAEMSLDHAYTSNCIQTLATALGASQGGANVEPHLNTARDAAARLAQSPAGAANHSGIVREGFDALASAFEARVPGQAAGLRQRAESIDPNGMLLQQRNEVQGFFSEAGEALRSSSNTMR